MKGIRIFFLFTVLFYANSIIAQNGWQITATSKDNYNGITMANGRIGLVSGADLFSVTDLVLNGVFDKESTNGVSRVVRGPVFTNMNFYINHERVDEKKITNWKQVLDMKEATLKTSIDFQNKAHIEYTLLALRQSPYMSMVIVEITPHEDISLKVENDANFPSELTDVSSTFKMLSDAEIMLPIYTTSAKSRTGMHTIASSSAFLFDDKRPSIEAGYSINSHRQVMKFEKNLKRNNKYRFALVGGICSTRDFKNPINEAERMSVYALQNKIDFLTNGHKNAWKELWQGDIEIEGDVEAQQDIRLALYNLYSFSRENTRLSIAPMGLSTVTGYNGHVFWDTELWMYPPLLLFNQGISKSFLDYRFDRLTKAKQKADAYGFKGAMFPWESDDTGEEATPTWCLTGTFEHHITADVGIAFWNYYRMYRDKKWLSEEGYPLLKEVADFWVSRSIKNSDGSYSINNVVGADEFAPNVNDNAFTNGSAATVLNYATLAAKELNLVADTKWKEVSQNMKFHYDKDSVMKEHSTYSGAVIKQADVNLLAFPLNMVNEKQMIRDLKYYEPKIFEDGPAMGNAILSILYSRLGNSHKAYELFKKSYIPNKRPPFGVLSESAFSNNPYFATGAGGMLQAVIYGFAGLDIDDSGLIQRKTVLPKNWRSITIKGVGPDKKTYTVK